MKIIIADDEKLVRSTLRSMLQELELKDLPYQIIGEARNGEELLELLRKDTPDLVFVDIKMPKLDGIEAIRIGKTLAPQASWVILSGFMEFDYAQQALRLGASDYLLKPAEPEQLERSVRETMIGRERDAQFLDYEFEHWLSNRYREFQTGPLLQDPTYDGYCFYSVLFYGVHRGKPSASRLNDLALNLQQAAQKHSLAQGIRCGHLQLSEDNLTSVWAWPTLDAVSNDEVSQYLRRQFMMTLGQGRQGETPYFPLTVLQSENSFSVGELFGQLEELHAASVLRASLMLNKLYSLAELRAETAAEEVSSLGRSVHQLVSLYLDRDYVGYHNKLIAFGKQHLPGLHGDSVRYQRITAFLKEAICPALRVNLQPAAWIETLQRQGELLLSQEGKGAAAASGDLVKRAMDYVDEYYQEDISIGSLAEELQVTPNYLSSLFHKKQGITFVKYVTSIRMLKAKELLLTEPDCKVQDVAQRVGYFSSRHFTKLFVEHYGCYPSEIRKKLGEA
ncbi:MAG: response regulator [Paenibacillaceae bacterium]|nr:response regulator [Paenibacillaceae bacterium]